MEKVGIFYGSTTGNTEAVAKKIQQALGTDNAEVFDVSSAKAKDLEQFANLIFGTSTWGVGDIQDDFDSFLSEIKNANLENKKVALFGCGDQDSYPDSFVDGMGQVWEALQSKPCKLIGETEVNGYNYSASRAEVNGKLVGLAIDEDNQSNLTDNRIKEWIQSLSDKLN